MTRNFGANPPVASAWMLGRTVEEIRAIREESQETGQQPAEVAQGDSWKKRLPTSDA